MSKNEMGKSPDLNERKTIITQNDKDNSLREYRKKMNIIVEKRINDSIEEFHNNKQDYNSSKLRYVDKETLRRLFPSKDDLSLEEILYHLTKVKKKGTDKSQEELSKQWKRFQEMKEADELSSIMRDIRNSISYYKTYYRKQCIDETKAEKAEYLQSLVNDKIDPEGASCNVKTFYQDKYTIPAEREQALEDFLTYQIIKTDFKDADRHVKLAMNALRRKLNVPEEP